MTIGKDILNTLKDIILLKEKIELLSSKVERISEKLDLTHEKVIRLETKFEVYEGLSRKTFPKP